MDLLAGLRAGLDARRAGGLYRRRRLLEGAQGPRPVVDGRRYLAFCSNDYLGLAAHPAVVAAWRRAAEAYGVGAGASHLVCGHHREHQALEEALADFVGAEAALLFSTGYMANLGVVTSLAGRGDLVLADRLNHASLNDACLLSRARLVRYPHLDLAWLRERLAGREGRALVVTDAVFSMDGDRAPLGALAAAVAGRGWLVADDAHGFGVLGPQGRGSLAEGGLTPSGPVVLMGTLGKACGVFGAFVAGDRVLVETLVQQARTYIYTTALPPALAAALRAALAVLAEADEARGHLFDLVARFRRGAEALGLPLAESSTPIQPLVVGDSRRALALARALESRGILVVPIRPPTVPEGTARLRITFSAAHRPEDVDRLLEALAEIGR